MSTTLVPLRNLCARYGITPHIAWRALEFAGPIVTIDGRLFVHGEGFESAMKIDGETWRSPGRA